MRLRQHCQIWHFCLVIPVILHVLSHGPVTMTTLGFCYIYHSCHSTGVALGEAETNNDVDCLLSSLSLLHIAFKAASHGAETTMKTLAFAAFVLTAYM